MSPVFLWMSLFCPRLVPIQDITLNLFPLGCATFSDLPCCFMILIVLRNPGCALCRMSFNLGLADVFHMIRWIWGTKTTGRVPSWSHHIRLCTVNVASLPWVKLDHLLEVMSAGFTHCHMIGFPFPRWSFQSPYSEWGKCAKLHLLILFLF